MSEQPVKSDGFYQIEPFLEWQNRSASGAVQVLLSPDFVQMKLVQYYEHLANDLGRDFTNIRYMARYIPLFHEGACHKILRQRAAQYLREIATDMASFEDWAVALVAQKMRVAGPVEIVSEIAMPIIERLSLTMSGLDYIDGLALILTGNNSLKAVKELDAKIGRMIAMSHARFPEIDPALRGTKIAFALLGAEPLGAALVASFDHILNGASGQKLSAFDWPDRLPATGLTELFRECKHAPQDLGGHAKNVRHVRLDMSRFLHESTANPDHIFGLGDHACLGRNHARGLWQRIAADMRRNPNRVCHLSSGAKTRKMLAYPGTISIEVLP